MTLTQMKHYYRLLDKAHYQKDRWIYNKPKLKSANKWKNDFLKTRNRLLKFAETIKN